MPVFQRFRSGDRDQATDATRLSAIGQAIRTAIADAERERDGLRRRAERAGGDAAFLIEGDTPSRAATPSGADRSAESQVAKAEEIMRQAERRLSDLDHQLQGLRDLLAASERLMPVAG